VHAGPLPWPGRLGITTADLLLSRIGGDHGPARTIITPGGDDDDPSG
jgi:hypothetical protein